ncbi:TPA: hypothetical protein ACT9K7_001804 [Legionella pneumophila]|uniref:hypothetical protein n=1 Tax=Legionella pneumophila TaxID=446 RepID=UPI003EEF1BEC
MKDPSYIAGSKFSSPNVDTNSLLKSQGTEHQVMFQDCLNLLKKTVQELELSSTSKLLPDKNSETLTTKRV